MIFFHFHALRIMSRQETGPAPIIYDIPYDANMIIFLPYLYIVQHCHSRGRAVC